jgi:hypothetical protein
MSKFWMSQVLMSTDSTSTSSAFNISHSETNLLKFEFGISNDLASILYLALVSGDNNYYSH